MSAGDAEENGRRWMKRQFIPKWSTAMVVLDVVSRLRGFAFEEEFSPPEFFRDQLYLAFYFFFPVHQPLGGVEKKTLVGALSALISPLEATRNTLVLTAHHLSFSV